MIGLTTHLTEATTPRLQAATGSPAVGASAWPPSCRCNQLCVSPREAMGLISARTLPKARLLSVVPTRGVHTALLVSDVTTDNYRGSKRAK